MQQQEERSSSPPKYGPYPGSTIAPNYPTQLATPPVTSPPPPSPQHPVPLPAPRHASAPRPDRDRGRTSSYYRPESSTYVLSTSPSSTRWEKRSPSPAETTYVCIDGVCTRLEPGTRKVLVVDQPRRNLAGYLILGIFVMVCFNLLCGLFAVIFAACAMSDDMEHKTSMQLGEASLCFSIAGIFCTIVLLCVFFLCYSPTVA